MAGGRAIEDRALLLQRYRYGESSLIVHLLTPSYGKVHLIVKGAYRPRSAYSGVFDLFDTLLVRWRPPRHGELGVASTARVIVRRRALSEDLDRYRTALSALELSAIAAQPGREEAGLFRLLETWLELLVHTQLDSSLAQVAFDLRFLQDLGLSPSLETCAACGLSPARGEPTEESSAEALFSVGAGGRLCLPCAQDARASGRRVGKLPANVLRIARSLQNAAPEHLPRFQVRGDALRDVSVLVQRFLDHHLETRPRSRAGQASTP